MLQTILRVDAPLVVETYQMSKSIFQSKLPIPLFKLLKSIFYPNEICTFKYTHMQFPFLDREGGILISDICSIIIYVQRPLYKCSSAGLHRIKSKLTFHNAPSIWTGISIKVNVTLQFQLKKSSGSYLAMRRIFPGSPLFLLGTTCSSSIYL